MNQVATVASVTDSPRAGTMTGVSPPPAGRLSSESGPPAGDGVGVASLPPEGASFARTSLE